MSGCGPSAPTGLLSASSQPRRLSLRHKLQGQAEGKGLVFPLRLPPRRVGKAQSPLAGGGPAMEQQGWPHSTGLGHGGPFSLLPL